MRSKPGASTATSRRRGWRAALRWAYRLLAVIVGVGLAAVLFLQGRRAYLERPILGALRAGPALADASAERAAGQFFVRWEPGGGGRVVVGHRSEPERALWASLPGRGFVAAGQGEAQVWESRAHFFLSDRLGRTCARQSVEALEGAGDEVVIRGRLDCSDGSSSGYQLRLAPRAEHRLGFDLSLEDPTLNRTYLTYASDRDEHFFGFGEQFSTFDLKGRRLPLFVSEQGIGRGEQPITLGANVQAGAGGSWHSSYAGVPHYITSRLRSLYLESYEYAVFDLRAPERVHLQLFAPQLRGVIIHGTSPAALIGEYTAATGRMRRLPDWILGGAVIGLQGGTERVREILALLAARETPLAGVWLQDWVGQRTTSFGRQLWWNWELDRERYPDWEGLLAELRAREVRALIYINSNLVDAAAKPGARRNLFDEARRAGYLVRRTDGEPYLVRNTDFYYGMLDLSNPDARSWMVKVIQDEVIGAGADGWMADFGESLPYDAVLASGEAGASAHNRYPELWAEVNRAAVEASGRGDELVFFMRSAYRGSPASSTLFWLGDQLVSWDAHDGIKTAVIGLLSGGMSGFSLNHSDIGGYTAITNPLRNYHRSKELLLRWMELGAFTAIYRTHEGNRPGENAQFYDDEESLAHFDRFARVYRAWGFYRRELVDEAARTGLPVARHLFIHYPADPQVYRLSYQEFLVGSELLVAPALDQGARETRVYLPAGRWVHVWSGETYGDAAGGMTVQVASPLGQPAVFYREGSEVGERFVANLRAEGVLP